MGGQTYRLKVIQSLWGDVSTYVCFMKTWWYCSKHSTIKQKCILSYSLAGLCLENLLKNPTLDRFVKCYFETNILQTGWKRFISLK